MNDVENVPSLETPHNWRRNAVFHKLKEVPGNFKQICHKILDMLPKKTDVVFSKDILLP